MKSAFALFYSLIFGCLCILRYLRVRKDAQKDRNSWQKIRIGQESQISLFIFGSLIRNSWFVIDSIRDWFVLYIPTGTPPLLVFSFRSPNDTRTCIRPSFRVECIHHIARSCIHSLLNSSYVADMFILHHNHNSF